MKLLTNTRTRCFRLLCKAAWKYKYCFSISVSHSQMFSIEAHRVPRGSNRHSFNGVSATRICCKYRRKIMDVRLDFFLDILRIMAIILASNDTLRYQVSKHRITAYHSDSGSRSWGTSFWNLHVKQNIMLLNWERVMAKIEWERNSLHWNVTCRRTRHGVREKLCSTYINLHNKSLLQLH